MSPDTNTCAETNISHSSDTTPNTATVAATAIPNDSSVQPFPNSALVHSPTEPYPVDGEHDNDPAPNEETNLVSNVDEVPEKKPFSIDPIISISSTLSSDTMPDDSNILSLIEDIVIEVKDTTVALPHDPTVDIGHGFVSDLSDEEVVDDLVDSDDDPYI